MRRKKKVLFITGTGTSSGKSTVTGLLALNMARAGEKVITQKFLQTGMEGAKISEDILRHREIMGIDLLPEDLDGTTCPLGFSFAAAPMLAAELENKEIDLDLFRDSTKKLLEKYDTVLIEGPGGLNVPITPDYAIIDYISENGYPVVMVAPSMLGSINYTILSLEACRAKGIMVEVLFYNLFDSTNETITDDTRKHFRHYLSKYHPCTIFAEIDKNMKGKLIEDL